MILYHGTTMDKAKEILDSKIIKCNVKRDFEETIYFSGTTDGYVYLTDQLHTAYYYGNVKSIGEEGDNAFVCIFKIDVPYEILCADLDELEVKTGKVFDNTTTVTESLEKCGCVRCPQDIGVTDAQYIIIPSTFNDDVDNEESEECRRLSKLQIEEVVEKKEIYKKIIAKYKWQEI